MRGQKYQSIEGIAVIESLDIKANGVARIPSPFATSNTPFGEADSRTCDSISDKNESEPSKHVIFIPDTLPGETVQYRVTERKKNFLRGEATAILKPSINRQTPPCEYFGICGGCSMQHIDSNAQVTFKQKILEDNFQHIGKLPPTRMLEPITGQSFGYRHRGRLSVKFVKSKQTLLIGFHERGTHFVTRMERCLVLHPKLGLNLHKLCQCLTKLSVREQIPQIEFAIGDEDLPFPLALTLRIMAPLSTQDEAILKAFADEHRIQFWLQTKGVDTAVLWYPKDADLWYKLPAYHITMPFKPVDFTQINHAINPLMIDQAIELLELEKPHRVLDLFCGLGNFTLPIARCASEVTGLEGSMALVERARNNAITNDLADKTQFACANLFNITHKDIQAWGKFDRWLVDPPRDGAHALADAIAKLHHEVVNTPGCEDILPPIIVYVSCNPATLARDAAILTEQGGYELNCAGIINMFPHTSHVESMAKFTRRYPSSMV